MEFTHALKIRSPLTSPHQTVSKPPQLPSSPKLPVLQLKVEGVWGLRSSSNETGGREGVLSGRRPWVWDWVLRFRGTVRALSFQFVNRGFRDLGERTLCFFP